MKLKPGDYVVCYFDTEKPMLVVNVYEGNKTYLCAWNELFIDKDNGHNTTIYKDKVFSEESLRYINNLTEKEEEVKISVG